MMVSVVLRAYQGSLCHKTQRRWLDIIGEVFDIFGGYEAELETERQLWYYCF